MVENGDVVRNGDDFIQIFKVMDRWWWFFLNVLCECNMDFVVGCLGIIGDQSFELI